MHRNRARLCCSKTPEAFFLAAAPAHQRPPQTSSHAQTGSERSRLIKYTDSLREIPTIDHINNGHAGAGSQVEAVDVCPDSGWHSHAGRESTHVRLHGETVVITP